MKLIACNTRGIPGNMFYSEAHITKLTSILLVFFIFFANSLFAEGSKELASNGGYRAYLLSSSTSNLSFPFPTLGTMKVYVNVGETIYVGSSAQGIGTGTINLRAPNGASYTSGTDAAVGLIVNRSQEVAGPLPNAGGYQAYTHTVLDGEQGIFEIDFMAPGTSDDQSFDVLPPPVPANADWTQPNGLYVTAFDVSVRDAANSTFLTGRAFTNVFCGLLGAFDVGFNGIFHILTQDGYQYDLDNNGQAGNGFIFFANNKGLRNADGTPAYKSFNSTVNPNVQDPRKPDTESDITHKLFFNYPDFSMPFQAKAPGGSTWLYNQPSLPTIDNIGFVGVEGSIDTAGTAPLGGYLTFRASSNGTYDISIDVDQNGVFTDPVDRRFTGKVVQGNNKIFWNGLDGLGKKVPASPQFLNFNINSTLFGAEVHLPFFDVERNVNGLKITRINGDNAPDNIMYWDDSAITIAGTPSNPVSNLTGISSLVNGHKWGSPATKPNDENDFGNNKSIDTWSKLSGDAVNVGSGFLLQESDLEVTNIASQNDCGDKNVSYTILVKNNGPSDVYGAKVSFDVPAGLNGAKITSKVITGTVVSTSGPVKPNKYNALLNMTNGASVQYTISGTVPETPLTGKFNVTASILRPKDSTDPDATNPDAAPPTDPDAECNALPSGAGCNNIKTTEVAYSFAPIAGTDQTIIQNTDATLVANISGTWSQVGTTPSVANIALPSGSTTTVSGLTTPGVYNFLFTSPNGCTAPIAITVVSSDVTIPNVFTPNGDGKNDSFVIEGLKYHPGSKLMIFNRWGNEVYHSDNYLNDWNGSGLAEGTYFYVLNIKEPAGKYSTFKGWVYLKR